MAVTHSETLNGLQAGNGRPELCAPLLGLVATLVLARYARYVIIGRDSQLRKIPVALDRKQGCFIEGVRGAIEMIDLAHTRLQQTLLSLSGFAQKQPPPEGVFTSAMLDAWSIVDSLHRLRTLAHHFPNVPHRKQIPGFHYLLKNTDSIEQLRNVVQHLPSEIRNRPKGPEWSLWGALSWCVPMGEDIIHSCLYMCGKVEPPGNTPLINPLGKKIRMPVGLITLSQDAIAVCLSDLMDDVERFATCIESMVTDAFNCNPLLQARYASDVYVGLAIKTADP